MKKLSFNGNTILYFRLRDVMHSTRIELFYFDDNFRRIAQWVPPCSVNVLPIY